MARVPLIDPDGDPAFAPFAETVRAQRRGEFLNIYKLLLQSPPLTEAWYEFNNAVRWGTDLSGRLGEMIIIRIGQMNGSAYTLRQHMGELVEAEGLSAEDCAALEGWRESGGFSDAEQAALAFTEAMTETVTVADPIFDEMARHYSERNIVELAVLIGSYNMHTRVF
ncbi:MAG: carboxymuconolactone decarboxylase family protein [Rhodospirillales bacterium]|jgi:alkylhydroperoxidase family enzyme|nr:carboxymuconolactone decarboxylase family protein [Rhodospirillales bacterium]